jgi:hypothetical protein
MRVISLLILAISAFAQGVPTIGAVNSVSASGATHIQSCGSQASGAQTSITCTFGSSVGAGHLIWVCWSGGTGSLSPVFSGETGSFTHDPNLYNYSFGGFTLYCGYFLSSSGGYTGLVITTVLSFPAVVAEEFNVPGGATFDTEDTPNTCSSGSGCSTTVSSNSISPTSGDVLVGFALGTQLYTMTPVSPFLAGGTFPSGSAGGIWSSYYIDPSSSGIPATWTNTTGGQNWVAHVVAFK